MAPAGYADRFIHVNGVRLHYQEWPERGASAAPAVLCLHGLTQQSHAFDGLAARLASRYRCLAPDFRGRGDSDWAAPATYTVPQYVADVRALLEAWELTRVHVVGTSLGGLVALSLAWSAPDRLLSLVLNDIGPVVDPRGGARIATNTAALPERFPEFEDAIAWGRRQYPWLAGLDRAALAEAIRWAVRAEADGTWRLRCDPAVGRQPRPATAAVEAAQRTWWRAFDALACPVLLVRGAESDVLSRDTAKAMQRRQPGLVWVEVPGVGHAPTLTEPPARAALDRFYDLRR